MECVVRTWSFQLQFNVTLNGCKKKKCCSIATSTNYRKTFSQRKMLLMLPHFIHTCTLEKKIKQSCAIKQIQPLNVCKTIFTVNERVFRFQISVILSQRSFIKTGLFHIWVIVKDKSYWRLPLRCLEQGIYCTAIVLRNSFWNVTI